MVPKKNINAMNEQKAQTGLPSRLIDLPGVGHIANLDDPVLFNRALEEWLESIG
ncbi:MAG: alpha/beta hydrolase [Spirochaetaceae bacterium]|nr:MAG: alpha/beta hydrolase [Spirochaetaceae bacterium]